MTSSRAAASAFLALGTLSACYGETVELPIRVDGTLVHLALRRHDRDAIELYDLAAERWLDVTWKENWTFGAVGEDGLIRYLDETRPGLFLLVADDLESEPHEVDPSENDVQLPTPGCSLLESRAQPEAPFLISPDGQIGYQCEGRWLIDGRPLPACEREGYVLGLGLGEAVYCDTGMFDRSGRWREYTGFPDVVYPNRPSPGARRLGVKGVRMSGQGMFTYALDTDGLYYFAQIDESGFARPGPLPSDPGPDQFTVSRLHPTFPGDRKTYAPHNVRFTSSGVLFMPLGPYLENGEREYRFVRVEDGADRRLEFPDVADVHYALQTP